MIDLCLQCSDGFCVDDILRLNLSHCTCYWAPNASTANSGVSFFIGQCDALSNPTWLVMPCFAEADGPFFVCTMHATIQRIKSTAMWCTRQCLQKSCSLWIQTQLRPEVRVKPELPQNMKTSAVSTVSTPRLRCWLAAYSLLQAGTVLWTDASAEPSSFWSIN